jgi:hypothetical protein
LKTSTQRIISIPGLSKMAEKNVPKGTQFISDIKYISTQPAAPAAFATGQDCGVPLTNVSAHPNTPTQSIN